MPLTLPQAHESPLHGGASTGRQFKPRLCSDRPGGIAGSAPPELCNPDATAPAIEARQSKGSDRIQARLSLASRWHRCCGRCSSRPDHNAAGEPPILMTRPAPGEGPLARRAHDRLPHRGSRRPRLRAPARRGPRERSWAPGPLIPPPANELKTSTNSQSAQQGSPPEMSRTLQAELVARPGRPGLSKPSGHLRLCQPALATLPQVARALLLPACDKAGAKAKPRAMPSHHLGAESERLRWQIAAMRGLSACTTKSRTVACCSNTSA